MRRRLALLSTLGMLAVLAVATPTAADEPPPAATAPAPAPAAPPAPPAAPPPAPTTGLRLDGGIALRELFGLPVAGPAANLALDFQYRKSVAFALAGGLFTGKTPNGIDAHSATLAVEGEAVLDRLRLGGGAGLFFVGFRKQAGDWATSWGPTLRLTARFDVVQTDSVALFLRGVLDAGFENASGGSLYWGPTLSAGIDFDVAGSRTTLR